MSTTLTTGGTTDDVTTVTGTADSTVMLNTTTDPTGVYSPTSGSPGTSFPRNPRAATTGTNSSGSRLPMANTCLPPPSVSGGAIISSGPYVVNFTKAVYDCFSGYYMSGAPSIMCTVGGTWSGTPPDCIPIDRNPSVDNNLNFGSGYGLPLWLAILLGIMAVLLGLLLLTCLLMYCLRLCGCWEGSVCGFCGDDPPYGSGYAGLVCCRQHSSRRRRIRKTSVHSETSMPDVEETKNYSYYFKREHADRSNGRPPQEHTLSNKPYASVIHTQHRNLSGGESSEQEGYTTPRLVTVTQDVIQKDKKRRVAKNPSHPLWMPHANPVRNINTSTK